MKQQWYCDTYTVWFNTTLSWSKTCPVLPVSGNNESCFHQPKAMHFYSPPTEVHSSNPQHNSPLVHFRLHLFLKCMRAIFIFFFQRLCDASLLPEAITEQLMQTLQMDMCHSAELSDEEQSSVCHPDRHMKKFILYTLPPHTHCGAEQSVPHWDNAELYILTFWGFWKIKGITDFYFLLFCFSFHKKHKDLSSN